MHSIISFLYALVFLPHGCLTINRLRGGLNLTHCRIIFKCICKHYDIKSCLLLDLVWKFTAAVIVLSES